MKKITIKDLRDARISGGGQPTSRVNNRPTRTNVYETDTHKSDNESYHQMEIDTPKKMPVGDSLQLEPGGDYYHFGPPKIKRNW